MKNTLKLMAFALLAFGLFACGGKQLTQDDLKEAESACLMPTSRERGRGTQVAEIPIASL